MPESDEQAVLAPVEHYALTPGLTRAYGPGVLHSTEHPGKAWVIRVTGTDVDAIPRFRFKPERDRHGREGLMALKFRVELVWEDEQETASSIYLTGDGRVILQGRAIPAEERATLKLPAEGDMISVDRKLIRAIKEML